MFERHISYHQTNARFLKWYVCLLWTISSASWYMFSFVEICNQMHKYTYLLSSMMIFKTLELLDVEYKATFTNSGIYWNLNSRPLAKQSSMLDLKLLAHRKNILAFLLYYLGRISPYTTNMLQYIPPNFLKKFSLGLVYGSLKLGKLWKCHIKMQWNSKFSPPAFGSDPI